jgi:hypothetical protein
MKTLLNSDDLVPEYDVKIVDWIASYSAKGWGGVPRRVGILAEINGAKAIYRAIDGDGIEEIDAAYTFLESIGLIDLGIYNHPRFNCVYGLPEHRPTQTEPISATCFG